ncbi:FkbM family methyltransferase [Thiothrix lacustris]|uniref:FkbM family methyltransferase n=1 Tax=Thiothrix lacustris TaxID=525917 RepID=UPI0027E5456F|nr:FkbM family methyltransferase [Thiothrix lacustris]WMP18895.1 FkbM family methyltransferase [Thiothrix lacustris]
MNKIYKIIFLTNIYTAKKQGWFWETISKTLRFTGYLLSRFQPEALVTYTLDGTSLHIPLAHALPFLRCKYPTYSSNLGRIAALVHEKYPTMNLIDIGANIGDSVAILRHYAHFPILCIDGDPYFFKILEKNLIDKKDVYLYRAFIGDTKGVVSGQLCRTSGTMHLSHTDSTKKNLIATKKLSDIITHFDNIKNVRMIKVDTDGFDVRIILSELDYLKKNKPILFFEYDPFLTEKQNMNAKNIFEKLYNIGYQYALFFDNAGDYLISLKLNNMEQLEDIHYYFSGRKMHRYCDICVFHDQDKQLFETARQQELTFFSQQRHYEYSI